MGAVKSKAKPANAIILYRDVPQALVAADNATSQDTYLSSCGQPGNRRGRRSSRVVPVTNEEVDPNNFLLASAVGTVPNAAAKIPWGMTNLFWDEHGVTLLHDTVHMLPLGFALGRQCASRLSDRPQMRRKVVERSIQIEQASACKPSLLLSFAVVVSCLASMRVQWIYIPRQCHLSFASFKRVFLPFL